MKHLATLTIFVILLDGCADSKLRVEEEDTIQPSGDVSEGTVVICGPGTFLNDDDKCLPEFDGCDEVDNDQDGQTDEDCDGPVIICGEYTVLVGNECVLAEICGDQLDNDNDGETDEGCQDCGNGQIDDGEDCDGAEFGGQTCETLEFAGGMLACENCFFNTSGCEGTPPLCGNGALDPDEDCDGEELGYATCEVIGFEGGGELACLNCFFDTSGCVSDVPDPCGNGAIDTDEDCDGDNIGYATCELLGMGFTGGVLQCDDDCVFDTTECTLDVPETCGNGQLDDGEDCDADLLDNATCETQGFDGGTLTCSNCFFNTSQCTEAPELCGNSQLDNGEDCDGDLLGGSSCESLGWGYTGGDLACDNCAFDDSGCTPQCGDGLCEAGESFATCPEDCDEVCVDNPQFTFGNNNPTELEQSIVTHVGQLRLEGGDQEVTLQTITLRVVAQVASPDSGNETWRLRSETTLIIADYDADVTGDENGMVVFNLDDPMTIAPGEVRLLDIQVNTAEMDVSGDSMQLFIQTDCNEVEGPTLVLP